MNDYFRRSESEIKSVFKELTDREQVADLLEISDYHLRHCLYIVPRSEVYKMLQVPKKSGEIRTIYAPIPALKSIQSRLNWVLKQVYEPKPSTHGFVIKRGIITNASQHIRQKCILNIDIKDFFPSINFGRVYGLFKAQPYNCTKEVATVLAQICCYENQIPQGAPTSPIISNMICASMDSQLQRLAQKYKCIYTRYADDITFSTSKARFPFQLAYVSEDTGRVIIGDELNNVLQRNGFSFNEGKSRLRTQYQHQEVTGITVNEKANVKRKYVRQIRAMLHAWEKYGLEKAEREFFEKFDKKKYLRQPRTFQLIVKGKIDFLGNVKGVDDQIYSGFLRKIKRLNPDLLNEDESKRADSYPSCVDQSYSALIPVIYTEGKTDWKHLKTAFFELTAKGHFQGLKLDFHEHEGSNQGSSKLLDKLKTLCERQQSQPIIGIIDRDEPNRIKEMHDESRGFKDWGNGVYSFAIPIPQHRSGERLICIEHYYKDEEIKSLDCYDRRLFMFNEFEHKTLRRSKNRELNTTKKHDNPIKIIDCDVFNSEGKNIALSKDKFALNIFDKVEGFNKFDFAAFSAIFETIEKILQFHKRIS